MTAEAILAKIQEEKKKSEDAQIEKSDKVINEFLEKHYLEKVTKARKQAADADALIEAIRGMGEEETEDIEDIDGSKDR